MSLRYWRILLIIWMGLIFLISSNFLDPQMSAAGTKEMLGGLNFFFRKFLHLAEYGILTYLWLRTIWKLTEKFVVSLNRSMALSVIYAITDEIHQSYVPQRLGVWYDVVLDSAGVLVMGYILWRVKQRGEDRIRKWVLGSMGTGDVTAN